MFNSNTIPVTASFRGAGGNAYELVEMKDKEGKTFFERHLVRQTKPCTITRLLDYDMIHNHIPSTKKRDFTHKGKINFKKWEKWKKANLEEVIRLNCEDAFWDLPEVHGKGKGTGNKVTYTIDRVLW